MIITNKKIENIKPTSKSNMNKILYSQFHKLGKYNHELLARFQLFKVNSKCLLHYIAVKSIWLQAERAVMNFYFGCGF